MEVYRITTRKYAHDLSGIGAGLYGGRWNPVGMNLVYTAEHISLAYLEYLVHNFHILHSQQVCLVKIRFDAKSLQEIDRSELPQDWNEKSYLPRSTQLLGASILNNEKPYALKVPSAISSEEHNILLNPAHPNHASTKIIEIVDPFQLDSRLTLS
ncbi:MAG: RES family NAD+ phosphorylase [Cyclobacteriaceae bacterium]